jgi:hypothetical protein
MASNSRLTNVDVPSYDGRPLCGPACQCLTEFFREEFLKHHQCLERQREYYSDVAITQAEDCLARVMGQIESLCQRDDACELIGHLLKQIDVVTKLSAWTDPERLH